MFTWPLWYPVRAVRVHVASLLSGTSGPCSRGLFDDPVRPAVTLGAVFCSRVPITVTNARRLYTENKICPAFLRQLIKVFILNLSICERPLFWDKSKVCEG